MPSVEAASAILASEGQMRKRARVVPAEAVRRSQRMPATVPDGVLEARDDMANNGASDSAAPSAASTTGTATPAAGPRCRTTTLAAGPRPRPLPATCGLGRGQPSVVSKLYVPPRAQPASLQMAMIHSLQERVRALRLQAAQYRAACDTTTAELAALRADHGRLQQWAVSQIEEETDSFAAPHKLPAILGKGYTPMEQTRTLYNHFHRAFEAVQNITDGDVRKTQQLFAYAADRLWSVAGKTEHAIVLSLREFFTKARGIYGDGRPCNKLRQALQAVLTAVAHAPALVHLGTSVWPPLPML